MNNKELMIKYKNVCFSQSDSEYNYRMCVCALSRETKSGIEMLINGCLMTGQYK